MKKILNKIISITLMACLTGASVFMALPVGHTASAADVSATASPLEQSGTPGATVSYSVTISNSGATNVDVYFQVSSARGISTPEIVGYDSSVATTIGAGASRTMIVDVEIATSAKSGQNDMITFTVDDGSVFVTSTSMTVNVVEKGAAVSRPMLGVSSYSSGASIPKAGSTFPLSIVLENLGKKTAYNVVVSYSGEGFFPQGTGGVQSTSSIGSTGKQTFTQTMLVGDSLTWSDYGSLVVSVTYTDDAGTSYSEDFTLTISLTMPNLILPTATPNASLRPQLVITSNSTDVDPLQPGSIFELSLEVKNFGPTDAKSVIMVLGGGAASVNDQGTPQAGISGSGADLTNFAPLGGSNIVVVGDIPSGQSVTIKQQLVVSVSIVPGAYTLKTSFSYSDANGSNFVNDQVVTLLVYSLPQLEIGFYMDPGMLTAGMSSMLPLQVTNLGKKSYVLGNMTVTSANADIMNNTSLVGALDPGGYYTLDSEVYPYQEGPLDIEVTINYTDDFNQARTITQTLTLQVMAAPEMPTDIPGEEFPVEPVTETFWSKLGRFFKGLFGLDSGADKPVIPEGTLSPDEGGDYAPIIVVPKG